MQHLCDFLDPTSSRYHEVAIMRLLFMFVPERQPAAHRAHVLFSRGTQGPDAHPALSSSRSCSLSSHGHPLSSLVIPCCVAANTTRRARTTGFHSATTSKALLHRRQALLDRP